ncbi:hypothetical protein CLAIMM_09945 [Cladophialophora immunda]|nr:hypothetical protein CLAIMM_09945 [Cladophialophora immunda]
MSFQRILSANIEGTAKSVRHRQNEFHRLHEALLTSKPLLIAALIDDNGYTEREAVFEYTLSLAELGHTYGGLSLERANAVASNVERGRDSLDRLTGFGVVYIRPDRSRSSLYSILSPLVAAMAAGNCVVAEIPATWSRTASVARKVLNEALSRDTFAVAEESPPAAFLRQCVVVHQSTRHADLSGIQGGVKMITSPSTAYNFAIVDRTADINLAAPVHDQFCADVVHLAKSIPTFHKSTATTTAVDIGGERRKIVATTKQPPAVDVVLAGRGGRIVTLQNRPSADTHLQAQDEGSPFSQTPTLVLYRVSSLEDAISVVDGVCGTEFSSPTPSLVLIFASQAEANYLSNDLNADLTLINTFAEELLVGPKLPRPRPRPISSLYTRQQAIARYSPDMFEEARPAIVTPTAASQILGPVGGFVFGPHGIDQNRFRAWSDAVQAPLRPTGQRLGERKDFFETGLQLGMGVVLTSVLAASAWGVRVALGGLDLKMPSLLELR